MTRHRRVPFLLTALLPLAALTACGTVSAGGTGHADEIASRVHAQGVSPDLVYVAEIPGFDLAVQSVGVIGDHGFGSVYVSAEGGRRISLHVLSGRMDALTCPDLPLADGSGANGVRCEQDGDLWYRTAGSTHEYARPVDGGVVRLAAGTDAVDRETLRSAAENAELLDVPAPSGTHDTRPTAPVERGDLPPEGDGAPIDPPAMGG